MSDRPGRRSKRRKESLPMTAQTQYLETDQLGVHAAFLLVLVLLLTLLGVVAHVAFA
jgi:hypothetical protein